MKRRGALYFVVLTGLVAGCTGADQSLAPKSSAAVSSYKTRTRTYYVAAEPVVWNYAPTGYDSIYGRALPGPWGDTLLYNKIRYVQYSDASFSKKVPQPAWSGILGPMLRGVVGDSMKVVFLNRSDMPLSIHPHGVEYTPQNEGAYYNPPRGGGDAVAPGSQYTYSWFVRPEAGPQKGEPSSKVWLYHSHAIMADQEIYKGLVGTIVITDPAHAKDDGSPEDVDKEFVTLWLIFNENTQDTPDDQQEPNLKHSINGLFFGNLKGLDMNQNDRVRWYLVALGTETDLHTPHWHGNLVKVQGQSYSDVVELLPASMVVGDMVPTAAGSWLLHCHVGDHMDAGMYTLYNVKGVGKSSSVPAAVQASQPGGWEPFGPGMHHH